MVPPTNVLFLKLQLHCGFTRVHVHYACRIRRLYTLAKTKVQDKRTINLYIPIQTSADILLPWSVIDISSVLSAPSLDLFADQRKVSVTYLALQLYWLWCWKSSPIMIYPTLNKVGFRSFWWIIYFITIIHRYKLLLNLKCIKL